MISLKVASANATGILTEVKLMINDPDLNPGIQQGLADCKATLLDAESQLEDTMAALLSKSKQDAQVWLKAALAAIDTCDASIPGDDDIISKQSVVFRQLCEIAVAISKAMTKDSQALGQAPGQAQVPSQQTFRPLLN
ncbi:putative invertase inhibitor [Trifolium pratense]|nr:putative invertase inhibitor [Trifolium pratense]